MALGTEINGRTKCPCGSGKTYAQCCRTKNFKFVRDKDGNTFKQVPMHPEVLKALKHQEQLFRKFLGRKPTGDDPIFLEKYEQSPEEFDAAVIDAMEEANIRPELQYAYRKTGLIVSEDTAPLMPERDVKEFHDAIEEYSRLKAQRKLPATELRKNPLFNAWTDLFILRKSMCGHIWNVFGENPKS